MTGSSADGARPQLYYEVHGSTGPFLLLVHGMLSSRAQWMLNLDALSEFSRPVVVELFGHGRSPAPDAPECYAPPYYMTEFERIRETLGAERWFLCGQSLGASLTIRYALERPQRVIAHAFTNTNLALSRPGGMRRPSRGGGRQMPPLETAGREIIDENPMNPARNRRLPPAVRAAFQEDMALMTPGGYVSVVRHTLPPGALGDRIGENKVPALLVVGEREQRFAEHRRHAERTMPKLEVVGLDGGHAVNIDAAEGFNAAMREFVLRHSAAQSG